MAARSIERIGLVTALVLAVAYGAAAMSHRPIALHPGWWSAPSTRASAATAGGGDDPLPIGLFVEPIVEVPWTAPALQACGMSCSLPQLFSALNSSDAYEARQYTDFIASIKRYDYLKAQGNVTVVVQYFHDQLQVQYGNAFVDTADAAAAAAAGGQNAQTCVRTAIHRPPLTPLNIPAVGTDVLPLYGLCEHRHGNASGYPFDLWLSDEWNGPVVFAVTGFFVDFYFGSPKVTPTYDSRLFQHPALCDAAPPSPQPPPPPPSEWHVSPAVAAVMSVSLLLAVAVGAAAGAYGHARWQRGSSSSSDGNAGSVNPAAADYRRI